MDKESLYVGITRHKENCYLYLDATRIRLNVRDDSIRHDRVSTLISATGQLEAPDALDQDDPGDDIDRDAVIRQVIYEGKQSREKGNGPSSIEQKEDRICEWIFGPEKKDIKELTLGTQAEEEARKRA